MPLQQIEKILTCFRVRGTALYLCLGPFVSELNAHRLPATKKKKKKNKETYNLAYFFPQGTSIIEALLFFSARIQLASEDELPQLSFLQLKDDFSQSVSKPAFAMALYANARFLNCIVKNDYERTKDEWQ